MNQIVVKKEKGKMILPLKTNEQLAEKIMASEDKLGAFIQAVPFPKDCDQEVLKYICMVVFLRGGFTDFNSCVCALITAESMILNLPHDATIENMERIFEGKTPYSIRDRIKYHIDKLLMIFRDESEE